MKRSIITAAAVAVAAGAGVAAAADDKPKPPRAPLDRPALVEPAPLAVHGGMFLPEPYPFGLHRDLADDMAKELGLPAERVAEAMRKAIGAQFDRRRDEALECFEDRKKCKAQAALPPIVGRHARPVPVRPQKSVKP